jgi:Tol biopolymer transport system component
MALAAGDRLGPYVLEAPIGSGGMGDVYGARDTRLDRTVAIKTVSGAFGDRFEREARAISALNHPHICTLHDVGRDGDTAFLVMELVGGTHPHGPLPVDKTIRYGIEVCSALEAAHKAGIVPRDLKPANIIVTRQGVKLLDFGLAKVQASVTSPTDGATAPVITAAHTVLGTLQYMSPEQVEGREADTRSDIFALGCVLYEFLTGTPAFGGKSSSAIMGAILAKEPTPIRHVLPIAPPALEQLMSLCLAKDRDDRYQSVHDVRLQLEWIRDHAAPAPTPVARASRRGWLIAGAAALVLAAAAFTSGYWLHRAPSPVRLSVALNLPPGFRLDEANTGLALSPDGQRLAIAASGPTSNQRLWIRTLGGDQLQPLAGTEDGTYPFWAPDGRSLGFFAARKLKVVELASGNVRTVADAPNGRGAAWSTDDTIAYCPDYQAGLFLVPAAGGAPQRLTTPVSGGSHRLPSWLPGARHVLFFAFKEGAQPDGVFSFDRTTGKTPQVAKEQSEARYVAPDLILFLRGRTLVAQPFDANAVRTTGDPVVVAENVENYPARATGHFSAIGSAAIVYRQRMEAAPRRRQTIYQADGTRISELGGPGPIAAQVFVSADGRRVATLEGDANAGDATVWVYDLATGARTRIRSETGAIAWSPDGKRLAFSRNGVVGIQPVDSSAPPEVLWNDATAQLTVNSWTGDGQSLVFNQQAISGLDLVRLPLSGERKLVPIVSTPEWETNATFAPDGGALAYISNQTGRFDIFVSRYPSSGNTLQVTAGGGQHPNGLTADASSRISTTITNCLPPRSSAPVTS